MTYKLSFLPVALREWRKLSPVIQTQLKKILARRLIEPRVPNSQLRGYRDIYKIKLRSAGYRLVYQVIDTELVVLVVAVGERNRSRVYRQLPKRLPR